MLVGWRWYIFRTACVCRSFPMLIPMCALHVCASVPAQCGRSTFCLLRIVSLIWHMTSFCTSSRRRRPFFPAPVMRCVCTQQPNICVGCYAMLLLGSLYYIYTLYVITTQNTVIINFTTHSGTSHNLPQVSFARALSGGSMVFCWVEGGRAAS